MAKPGATRVLEQGAWVVLFGLSYFGAGILGNIFYFEPERVATFWPASGVFLAGLLLSSYRQWPVLVLAAVVAHVAFDTLVSHKAVTTSLFFTSADVVEACAGAFLLGRVLGMSGTLVAAQRSSGPRSGGRGRQYRPWRGGWGGSRRHGVPQSSVLVGMAGVVVCRCPGSAGGRAGDSHLGRRQMGIAINLAHATVL